MTTVLVATDEPGWRYLQIPMADTVDRSGVEFDDSGWSVGQGPFGTPGSGSNTLWEIQTAIWLRRDLDDVRNVTISGRVDNLIEVYWNGSLVGSDDFSGLPYPPFGPYVVPNGLIAAHNVLAIRAQDDVVLFSGDACAVSVLVEGTVDGLATRLYPRDDGRGLSPAARIHPAPRSRRIVGGYL